MIVLAALAGAALWGLFLFGLHLFFTRHQRRHIAAGAVFPTRDKGGIWS